MRYTNQECDADMQKIFFGGRWYLRTLMSKQHGIGISSVHNILQSKKRIGKAVLKSLGIHQTNYLDLLLTIDALASPPFGEGGEKALKEAYGYDRQACRVSIIKELNLSSEVLADFEGTRTLTTEMGIVKLLDMLLAKCSGLIADHEKEIIDDITKNSKIDKVRMTKKLYAIYSNPNRNILDAIAVAKQEESMKHAIEVLETQHKTDTGYVVQNQRGADIHFTDPLMWFISSKEGELA